MSDWTPPPLPQLSQAMIRFLTIAVIVGIAVFILIAFVTHVWGLLILPIPAIFGLFVLRGQRRAM